MQRAHLHITPEILADICRHMRFSSFNPPESEEAGFLFCKFQCGEDCLELQCAEWCGLTRADFVHQSFQYLELKRETRASVIKRAHDLDAVLIEVHSHPDQIVAQFSYSDISGFRSFVPHIRFRLFDRPYGALVVTPASFDSLFWASNSVTPDGPIELVLQDRTLLPTRNSYRKWEARDVRRSA